MFRLRGKTRRYACPEPVEGPNTNGRRGFQQPVRGSLNPAVWFAFDRLARQRKVNVIMLIVAHPSGATHELYVLLQERSARGGKQLGQVRWVEYHQGYACTAGLGRKV